MQRLSVPWILGSSFLIVGGFIATAIVAATTVPDSELAVDALMFGGPLVGGLIAALASRRRALGEVGLGAVAALLTAVLFAVVVFRSNFTPEAFDGARFGRMLRAFGLFSVGAMVGAALGNKITTRRQTSPIVTPLFWLVVSTLSTFAMMALTTCALVRVVESHVVLGFGVMAASAFGACAAQLMAPVRSRLAIALGSGALPALAMGIGTRDWALLGAGLWMVLLGFLGAAIALKIRPKSTVVGTEMPVAAVQ